MEEDKILLQVISSDNGTAVKCQTSNLEEAFQVALAIHTLVVSNPQIAFALISIANMQHADPDFAEILKNSTVDIPDFDSLLKNIK